MPPKKGKQKAAPKEVIIGEYNLTGMNRPELQNFVVKLQQEVEKARQARNAIQVERDEIESSMQWYRREIRTKKDEILLKEHEIEEADKAFKKLMAERKQKREFISYERQRKLNQKSTFATSQKQEIGEQSTTAQNVLLTELKSKETYVNLARKEYEDSLAKTDTSRLTYLNKTLASREAELQGTIETYEDMYKDLNRNILLLKDVEVHELEEQKTSEYHEYLEKYLKSMKQLKIYFKEIVGKSLSLIDTLKTQIHDLNKSEEEMINLRNEILEENRALELFSKELRIAKIHLAHYEQDKKSNAFTSKRINEYLKRINELTAEHESLMENYKICLSARENLRVQFVSSLRIIADALGAKKNILERKIQKVLDELCEMGENIESLKLQDIDPKKLFNFPDKNPC